MLPRMPPQRPLEETRSTETGEKSSPLAVTEMRETEEERAWGRETASWAEPLLEGEEQAASSDRQSAGSSEGTRGFMSESISKDEVGQATVSTLTARSACAECFVLRSFRLISGRG